MEIVAKVRKVTGGQSRLLRETSLAGIESELLRLFRGLQKFSSPLWRTELKTLFFSVRLMLPSQPSIPGVRSRIDLNR